MGDLLRDAIRSLNAPIENVVPVLVELPNPGGRLKIDMSGYTRIQVGSRPLGSLLLDPVVRFFRVEVWSWLP